MSLWDWKKKQKKKTQEIFAEIFIHGVLVNYRKKEKENRGT
jgi:hypothetical protein